MAELQLYAIDFCTWCETSRLRELNDLRERCIDVVVLQRSLRTRLNSAFFDEGRLVGLGKRR